MLRRMLKRIVLSQDQAARAGTSYSSTSSGASSSARDQSTHTSKVLGAVDSAAAGVARSKLLTSAAKRNGGPLRGARPTITIATATETLPAPVPVPAAVLSLASPKPSKPFAPVRKTPDINATDAPLLLLTSSETKPTAVPSRGRTTSPRARVGRPPSPRRSPRSPLSRSPSPRRSGTAVRAAAVDASSWPAAARPAASRVGGDFSPAVADKDGTCKHGSREVGTLDASGTPPLTPASPVPSPAMAISAGSSSFNVPFFGSRYGRDDDGGDLSEKGDEVGPSLPPARDNGASPAEHGEIPPVRGSGAGTPLTPAKLVVPVDDGERTETAAAAPAVERSSGDGDNKRPRIDVGHGDFGRIVKGAQPGVLRAAFITNVRQRRAVAVGEGCALVQAARVALGGSEGCVGARSPLQEIGIIGEGSFGIVSGATHSFLPGEFAVKRLKEGADKNARYCARVEMIVMARLTKNLHPNIIRAVSIDDRAAAVGMPILLPRANGDFGQVLNYGGWTMLAKDPHPNIIGAVSIDDRAAAIAMPILLPRAHGDFG
ncbi:unnamed protein product [Ectocarpus sp. 8 AP-2014]